jgi:hypothetical protein
MSEIEQKAVVLAQRLCSEIKLFDLCNEGVCDHRNENFCTDPLLLGRFERIADVDLRISESLLYQDAVGAEDDDHENIEEYAMTCAADGDDDGWEYKE